MPNASSDPGAGRGLGRAAGFGYLAIFITGIGWYAPFMGFRAGGDSALLGHIQANRLLFEISLLSGAATFVAYLVTASLLHRRYVAEAGIAVTLLFAFVVGSVSLSLAAVGREMQILALLDAKGSTQDLGVQLAAILRDFDAFGQLSSLFWGLWLLPLAWLAWRSAGLGRIVGVLVTLGGLGYMSAFVQPLFVAKAALPGAVQLALNVFAGFTVLSEVVVTLWLIFAADRPRRAKG